MLTLSNRANRTLAIGAGLVAVGLTFAFGVVNAGAQPVAQAKAHPGDNGDVKIHNSTTSVSDHRNEPHVCLFYLDAFNFDPAQSVSWWIDSWPPTGNRSVVDAGTITLDSSGDGATADQTLPNGHYKLYWTFAGEKGSAKHKVFWVNCPAAPPTSPPPSSPPPTSPPPTSPSPSPSTASPSSPSSSSPSPTPSPTGSTPASPAPTPTPVQTTLPVTG